MQNVVFRELGFPVVLVGTPTVELRGERVPDVNLKDLQEQVFRFLVTKRSRLTGAEVRFIRKYRRLRQADLAAILNMATHSVVSQWEGRQDEPTGMEYNTEVVLRLWMASEIGLRDQLADLLMGDLKDLALNTDEPVSIEVPRAA